MNKTVDGGKITNKKSLDRVAEQTGQNVEKLYKLPHVEKEILYIFKWFCELKGAEPLTYQEIEKWDKLNGYGVTPAEVSALIALDGDFYESRKDGDQ